MASVSFRNVSKVYGGSIYAVRNIRLEIEDGAFYVIVGPSGCGKTTLLRLLSGLEDATGGDIYISGRKINGLPPGKRNVSMVFQNYALFPHMSVYDNIAFGLKIRKLSRTRIRASVHHAADLLDLGHCLDRKPAELSGGQRQRTALGRALVKKPDVFLFDEPLSNLDAKLRGEMRVELLKLHKRLHSTVLYVTHDQVEAMTLADSICVLDRGLIQQVGTPDEIYNSPVNTFVASFFGSPPMNLFEGERVRTNGEPAVRIARDIEIPLAPISPTGEGADSGPRGKAILGIRPGAFSLMEKRDSCGPLAIQVDAVELIGEEKYVHGRDPSGGRFTATVPGDHPAAAGEELELWIDPSAVHVFDGDGKRLENPLDLR